MEKREELDPDCIDIFKLNMVDRYIESSRYKNEIYDTLVYICCAIYVAYYHRDY